MEIQFERILCSESNLLRDWLDLSLNHSVPSSLLILSRLKPEEVVGATLSSLPDEVVDTGHDFPAI
ncbi:hypothetical protein KY290_009770 [Solanum tuberosum]|uniref:Uncharacterized protein n=1 Tax=Solanum tuberosum TaxID=4113 RepID=A0ABQ7VXS7_SOLTU|nr:hypothetical protein KY289_010145 [Solanum tuberosum]KAH0772633.1 hypothetical protein KY290_009770 [Solanum tuberosum]